MASPSVGAHAVKLRYCLLRVYKYGYSYTLFAQTFHVLLIKSIELLVLAQPVEGCQLGGATEGRY
jgi:hypothetical protein